ncbi:MAG TPA: TldD/PmbA family protein [bacterium]|nr:TldD/PmbA family protein [bacterium]
MHRRDFIATLIKASGAAVFLGMFPDAGTRLLAAEDRVIDSFRSTPDRLADLLEIIVGSGADFADVFVEQVISRQYTLTNGSLTDSGCVLWEGIGIRGISGRKTAFSAVNGYQFDPARDAAREICKTLNASGPDRKLKSMPEHPVRDYGAILARRKVSQTGDAEVLRLLLPIQNATPASSNLIQRMALTYTDRVRRLIVADSDGRFIMDQQPSISLEFAHTARIQSAGATAIRRMHHRCGMEFLENTSVKTTLYETTAEAVEMVSAKPVPEGSWPVALQPRPAAVITKTWLESLMLQESPPGTPVAPEHLRLIDNSRIQNAAASSHFDDEGTRTAETVLVQNRQVVRRLNDRITAARRKEAPTGNGRRADFTMPPGICPSNCYLASTRAVPNAPVEAMDNGVLVRSMVPLTAGPEHADSVFRVISGWWIQKGVRAWPIRNVLISAPFAAILNTIDLIGDDISFEPETFGESQVPCAFGAPSMRIASMTVRQLG